MVASLCAPQLCLFILALGLDLQSLRSVIWSSKLLEPWVLQCFLRGDSTVWVVYEDFLQKIEEIAAECVARWYNILFEILV